MGDAASTVIPPPVMNVQDMVKVMVEIVGAKAADAAPLVLHSCTMVNFKLASDKRIEDGVCAVAVQPYLEALMGAEAGAAASASFNIKCDEIISAAAKEEEYQMQDDDLCHIDFSLAYGGKVLLQNTRMHLKKGRRYGLIGGNGVGKTTLMRAIDNNQLEEFPNDVLRTIFVESHSSQEGDDEEMTVMQYILANEVGSRPAPRSRHRAREGRRAERGHLGHLANRAPTPPTDPPTHHLTTSPPHPPLPSPPARSSRRRRPRSRLSRRSTVWASPRTASTRRSSLSRAAGS